MSNDAEPLSLILSHEETNPPLIDFSQPPEVLENYRFGDPINRNNFVSFLVDGFRRSLVMQADKYILGVGCKDMLIMILLILLLNFS